jgi:hypothetical protein
VAQIPLGCLCFSVGPIPIVIIPEIDINLVLSGSIQLTSSASASIGGAVTWSSASGFNRSSYQNFTTNGAPLVSVTGSGTAELQVQFNLCLYGILCAGIEADGTLTATLNTTSSPFFTLCPSLSLDADFSLDIVIWSTSDQITLASLNFACFTIANAPPVNLSVSPTNPTVPIGTNAQTFTAARSDGKTPTNNWSLTGATLCDSISPSGVLSTCAPGGRKLTVKDNDTTTPLPTNDPASTPVTVGTICEYDPPSDLSATRGPVMFGNRPAEYTVTWKAPTNTGCFPIVNYLVTVTAWHPYFGTASSTTFSTTSLSTIVPVFGVAGQYSVQIDAFNGHSASPTAVVYFDNF